MRNIKSIFVFSLLHIFEAKMQDYKEWAKIRHILCIIIIPLHLSYICFFLGEKAKTQRYDKVKLVTSYFRFFGFHMYKRMRSPIQSLTPRL